MNKTNKKGFTLAELLIVVAIIAVLVAIAIPVFNSQLEKSRDAVSVANLRAAYAEASVQYLTEKNGTAGDVVINDVVFKGKKVDDFSGLGKELPFLSGTVTVTEPVEGKHNVTFSFDVDGKITAVAIAA